MALIFRSHSRKRDTKLAITDKQHAFVFSAQLHKTQIQSKNTDRDMAGTYVLPHL